MTENLEDPYAGRLLVVDHPYLADRLTTMRDVNTPSQQFRAHLQTIATFLAYEALADAPLDHRVVETPLQLSRQPTLPALAPALVSILRAGTPMVDGALLLSPASPVGLVGIERNAQTLEPHEYFVRLPQDLAERCTLVCDPMLATGGSLCHVLRILQVRGARDLRVLSLLAAPEGVERVLQDFPEVRIWTAALDDQLDEKGYIVPGLGDAGDRIYGS